ncbi:MAG: hypothetical protein QOJ38_896 [Solirubrobacterales bacterium]|jgi:hypothetical protein|nr:hypothetical protein [Solirubrobacterales bacterium]
MPDVIKTIGALAGLGSFLGITLLAVLYFSQARDVRRLRDWAGRAPERAEAAEEALAAYELQTGEHAYAAESAAEPIGAPVGAAVGGVSPPMPVAPAGRGGQAEEWQLEAEAAAAAELDERRQQRERTEYSTERRRLPEVGSSLVVLAGGLILLFAIVFGAIHVFGGGGSDTNTASKQPGSKKGTGSTSSPGKLRVAVLNGTAVPGLAAKVGDDVRGGGFKLGAVTNSQSSFDTTVVMYRRGHQPEAQDVARRIGVQGVELMSAEIQSVSKGAEIAVVVGQDRVPAGATTGVPSAPAPAPTPTPTTGTFTP